MQILGCLEVETVADLDAIVRRISAEPESIETLADSFKPAFDLWRSSADLLAMFVGFHEGVPTEVFDGMYKQAVVARMRKLRGEAK
jgi:hypothetical protein